MAGVDGLSNGNTYTDAERAWSRANENISTQQAINVIANHAGLDTTHTVHGTDTTEGEVVAEHQAREQDRWLKELISLVPGGGHATAGAVEIVEAYKEGGLPEAIKSGSTAAIEAAALETAERLSEHAIEHGGPRALRALGGAALVWDLLKFAKTMADSVAADGDTGLARAEARIKSAMHTVVIGCLNGLPQAFVDKQRDHYAADAPKNLVNKMSRAMGRGDNVFMGVIQHHCDEGLAAARTMFDSHQTPADFFRAHPDLGKRFADDPAFHDGFAGAMYARAHGQYDAVMKALDARDPRSAQTQLAFRG